jgi:hypothetical protein
VGRVVTTYFYVECSCGFKSDGYTTINNTIFDDPTAVCRMIRDHHRRKDHYGQSASFFTRIETTTERENNGKEITTAT